MSVSTGEWIGIGIGAAVLLIVIGYLIYKHIEKKQAEYQQSLVYGIGDKLYANAAAKHNEDVKSGNWTADSSTRELADRNYQAHQDRVLDAVRRRDQNKKGTVNSPKPRKKSKEKKVSKKKTKK